MLAVVVDDAQAVGEVMHAIAGDPFDGYWNFLTQVVVVKGGQIVVDKRGQPNAGKPIVRYGY